MTDRPSRSAITTYLASAILFVGFLGFLGARVAQGQDPALGPKKQPVAQVVQPRRVLVRKVIVTKRIVVIKPAAPSAAAGGTAVQASAPVSSGQSYTPPAQTYTPAPAAAPAPAPAPVQSSTS